MLWFGELLSVDWDAPDVCDGTAFSSTEGKRESLPCSTTGSSVDGLFPSLGATEVLCPVCSFCSLLPKAISDSDETKRKVGETYKDEVARRIYCLLSTSGSALSAITCCAAAS